MHQCATQLQALTTALQSSRNAATLLQEVCTLCTAMYSNYEAAAAATAVHLTRNTDTQQHSRLATLHRV